MNDYEKAIDILESVDTGIQGAKAIEMLKSAITELESIKKRAEEERVKAMGFIEDYKHLNDIAICQSETEYNNRHIYKLTDDLELIDFIIKGEGK